MSDQKTDKNYEDLKAKLGIKKREIAAPAPAASSTSSFTSGGAGPGEPERSVEGTPAGGFDLGLERGGRPKSQASIDAERAAASLSAGDLQVKTSSATKFMLAFVAIALCAVAFFMGSSMKQTMMDRTIADQQIKDAETILSAIKSIKVGTKGETLEQATDAFIVKINATSKRLDDAQKADAVTPALLKSLQTELDGMRQASIDYVNKGARLGDIFAATKELFNGQAVQEAISYGQALDRLYNAASLMANEKAVLEELQAGFDVATLQIPPKVRYWRWATVELKDGSRKGFLLGCQVQTDAAGKFITQVKAPEVPPGGVPDPNARATVQVKVRYDDPKQAGKPEDWVDQENLVEHDLQPDIDADVKNLVAQQQGRYSQLLLARLFGRVGDLKSAAEGVPAARQKSFEKLAALAGNK